MDEGQKNQLESMLSKSDSELEQKQSPNSEVADEGSGTEGGRAEAEDKEKESSQQTPVTPEGSQEGEGEDSKELSEAEVLRQQVNSLSKKLKEAGVNIETSTTGSEQEVEGEEGKEKTPSQDYNFLSEEEIEALQDDPTKWNSVLNKVYNKAREDSLKSMPDVVRKTTDRQILIQNKVRDFYQENPDLKENRDFVGYVASEIEAENPDKDLDWIFEQSAKETRKRLGLREKAEETEKDRRTNSKQTPAFASKPRGERRAQDNRTDQQKQIDEVIDL